MNETPRLRSAFPATPRTNARLRPFNDDARRNFPNPQTTHSSSRLSQPENPTENVSSQGAVETNTVIPLDLIDAPTQRLYVAALYAALSAWRIYDFWYISDDLDSTWLFLKWIGFDAAFFISLPSLRIPWLEWSFSTTLTTWLIHVVANAFLMYRIPIPVGAWIGVLFRTYLYDREIAISEHRVKPADVINNQSLILGKQIIQILPEGWAILNPDRQPFCLDSMTMSVDLPIQINQTSPILIELLRYDLDTHENETITISGKQARVLKKQADKLHDKLDTKSPRILHYSTSKPGLYQLQRVVDESKLEVRKRSIDTAVVMCPRASISTDVENKCLGELSGVSLRANGVPPFKVRYSKRINRQQFSSIVQSIQPTDVDPFLKSDEPSNVLIDPQRPYLDWTRSSTHSIDINESLHQNGSWTYNIEEVEDGLGNKVIYDSDGGKNRGANRDHQQQSLIVHNRPMASLPPCGSENSLRIAKEYSVNLPVELRPSSNLPPEDWPLKLTYSFTPETHDDDLPVERRVYHMSNERSLPRVIKAGRYTLESVESNFCSGQINEPSSCLLYNPPEPGLSLESEKIFDKCAGNPIGLAVDLMFTGTPPFKLRYTATHQGSTRHHFTTFKSLHGHMELIESSAGFHSYQFLEIEDEVYDPISLANQNLIVEQDIKPPASAFFTRNQDIIKACLGQPVSLDVKFTGEGPWNLEYEVVHGGKRKKFNVQSANEIYTIAVPELSEGGRQSVILSSVQDKTKCRFLVTQERTIDVRTEQPRASFGEVEGRRSILAVEGKSVKLPLRLKGVAPWAVQISSLGQPSGRPLEFTLGDANDVVSVDRPGTYEILSVHDSCPGLVDPAANKFEVQWVARPRLVIKDPNVKSQAKDRYEKKGVCEGDEDALDLTLTGNPPYLLKYQQKYNPSKGPAAVSNRPLSVSGDTALVNMDTSKAGEYTYTFQELSDDRYPHDRKHFQAFVVRQHVYPLPSARFTNPGKTFGYCKDDVGGTENIPIRLEGVAPFTVEIGITHRGSAKPEIVRVKDILSNDYSWTLSHHGLELGTHNVQIRSVKDSRGCEKIIDSDPSSVRIMVSNPPTIIPLESQIDICVGDRVSYTLSGQPPFEVFYEFQGHSRKAKSSTTMFKRLAEQAGEFTVTAVSDNASGKCKAIKNLTKIIHPLPSVRISRGKTLIADIHEGGEVEIVFEFTGTPPFEFTYTRSENAKKGKKGAVLETRNDKSDEFSKTIRASDEGTYEVVAIKDRYCAYSIQKGGPGDGKSQKLLQQ